MSALRPPPQSVLRVIGILELLSGTATGVTLSALARALEAPKNSLVTLLAGLMDGGYVTRDDQSRYRIGPAGFALGTRLTGGTKLPGLVRPALRRLVDATGETAIAGVLSPAHDSVIYVDKSESRNPMRYTASVGEHRELYCTALGRLALAYMASEQKRRCIDSLRLEPITGSTITNRRALGAGNQSILGATAPSETYPCKGGGPNDYCYIYTSRAGNAHWKRLLEAIDRRDLADDPRFASPEERWTNRAALDAIISEWTRRYDKHEVMARMGAVGVPAGAVLDSADLMFDPHLRERGIFFTVEHPVRGPITLPGWPVHMSESRVAPEAPPLLGQHNEQVYGSLLGVDATRLEELRSDGAI